VYKAKKGKRSAWNCWLGFATKLCNYRNSRKKFRFSFCLWKI